MNLACRPSPRWSPKVLDFRQNAARRKAQGRQERRRLLLFVLLLGVTVVLIGWARDPAIWRSFDRLLSPAPDSADRTSIDNRLDAVSGKPAGPDGFLVTQQRAPVKSADDGGGLPGVKAEDFSAVRDDAPSTQDEQSCSLRLLDLLNKADPETLAKASLGPVSYAQLFREPDQYRGRLVNVSGIVRRANRMDLFPNDYGFKAYYQVWLWPSDNPSAPIVVYCLALPNGFPIGMEFAEQAEATGFFFKRWAYQSKDGLRTAPTILARTLRWEKRPVMRPESPPETRMIPLVVGLAALFALAMACYVYLRTRPRPAGLAGRAAGLRRPA